MITNKTLLLERESHSCAKISPRPKAVVVHDSSALETSTSGANVLSIPSPERFLKVMRRRFRQPPSYLRKDHPKTEWLVKPNKQDFDLNADEILEMLANNRIPKVKVGRPSGRGSRRRKGGVRRSRARKIKMKTASNTTPSALASEDPAAVNASERNAPALEKEQKKFKKKEATRRKKRKQKKGHRLSKDERKRRSAEKQALAEVLAAADMRAEAEQAAALAAPTAKLKNKVWTSLNAARNFICEEQDEDFVNRMAKPASPRMGESKLHMVLLKENHDLLQNRSMLGVAANVKGEPLRADATGSVSARGTTHLASPPHHGHEMSGFVSIKSMQAKQDHQRLREKLRDARRDEAKPWMFKRSASSPRGMNIAGVEERGAVYRGEEKFRNKDNDREDVKGHFVTLQTDLANSMLSRGEQGSQVRPLNFVQINIAKASDPVTPECVVTARSEAKQDRREETYARAMQLREDERTAAQKKASSREHRALMLSRREETRQRRQAWLKLCAVGSRWQKFTKLYHLARERQLNSRLEKSAASVILRGWNRKTAKKRGMEFRGAYMTVQRACLTLIMRRRATVKKRSTERIMSFMCGIAVQRFRAVMLKYRNCVVKVQRYYRSFRQCKHARILALNYIWDEVETELRIIEKRKRQRRLRAMLSKLSRSSPWLNAGVRRERVIKRRRQANKADRNASADVAGVMLDGETVDGVQFVVGDRKAALLDFHLRDSLQQIMRKSEFNNAKVENVPFDIRFEVLFVLLSELRKKHGLEISAIRQMNEKIRSQVTRAEIKTFVSDSSANGSGGLNMAGAAVEERQAWQKGLNDRTKISSVKERQTIVHNTTPRKLAGKEDAKQEDAVENQSAATAPVASDDLADVLVHASANSGIDVSGSASILPYPQFIVYSNLNETSLLTIVNAGRKLFERRKMEGYMTTFGNIKPLYLPRGSESPRDDDKDSDEIWHQLHEEAEDRKRSEAARNRRKSNTGFKIQNISARNRLMRSLVREKSKQEKAESAKDKNRRKHFPGVITSVPDEFRSRLAKSKFVYSRMAAPEATK